jgi:hypothetical protein
MYIAFFFFFYLFPLSLTTPFFHARVFVALVKIYYRLSSEQWLSVYCVELKTNIITPPIAFPGVDCPA